MTNLMPFFCPHCLANLIRNGTTEVKTSNPPKCGNCLLPLWWEDRSGKIPDRPWPSYLRILHFEEKVKELAADEQTLRALVAKLEVIAK